MAIITRFFFTRYKEVSYQTPSGQVSDEPYGSFSLDNPSQTNNGTVDFFGVMQTRHLLGDLRKITIDTGNVSLIQYDNLTDADINQRIANGIFQVNDQRIGWVDLGKATPSFFYNDCTIASPSPDGKRPVVNYFYDISQLGLNGNIVSGEQVSSTQTTFLTGAPPIPELEVIGTFNVNETNLAWGPYPTVRYTNPNFQGDDIRQFGVSFDFYLQRVINGSTWTSRTGEIQSGTVLNVIPSNGGQLLSATKESHFDNVNAQRDSLNRYGTVRRTITSGFRSFGQSSVGQCLPTFTPGVRPGVPGVTPSGPEVTSPNERDFRISTGDSYSDAERCFEGMSFDFKSIDGILSVIPDNFGAIVLNELDSNFENIESYQVSNNFNKQAERGTIQLIDSLYNIRDPREMFGDNMNNPKGIYHAYTNKDCKTQIFPAYLKKDGDIPELIGPLRANSAEDYRKFLKEDLGYYYKALIPIGENSNGLPQFSDGQSFIELATPSAYGGTMFSISISNRADYGNQSWNTIQEFLFSAKQDAIRYINGQTDGLSIILPPNTYRYLYDNHSLPVVIRSKTGRYRLVREPRQTIFLGFNDARNYDFSNTTSLLSSLSKNDLINYGRSSINKNRPLQYGKNPLLKLVENYKINLFNVQQFPNPKIKIDNLGNLFVEVIDQTYLLDIYISLMVLHLTGYDWSLIMEFMTEYDKIVNSSSRSVVRRRRSGISIDFSDLLNRQSLLEGLYNKISDVPFLRNNFNS